MAYDVFISYRRADGQALANKVTEQLQQMGFKVFLDTDKMRDGEPFPEQIEVNIKDTPNVILLITPEYLKFRGKEDWCKEEIQLALKERNRSPGTRCVLPVYPRSAAYLEQKELPKQYGEIDKFRKLPSVKLFEEAPNENEYRRIAKAISGINPHNIWNSAQRYLENNKRPGRRFGNLHICDAILPCGKATADTDLPINGVLGDQKQPLLEAVKQTNAPLYIIGEGGIGKTTALIRIMEDAYEGKTYQKESSIPLFVELNLAPSDKNDKCYEGGKSTFIIRQVCSILRREKKAGNVSFSDVERMEDEFEKTVIPFIEEDFRKESTNPQYWLLLDGLNEVSQQNPDTYGLILKEVIFLLKECPNVRVILTDRNDETSLSCAQCGITKFYLSGIDRETISAYLHQKEMQTAETLSEEMLDILRIPLFLTMYASLKSTGGVTSRGGLLRRFFHEKSDAFYSEYNQQERLEASGYNSQQMAFILDFIIPAIAWHMEKDGKFAVDSRYCENIVFPLLQQEEDDSFIGYYGKTVFEKYKRGRRVHVKSVAKDILNLFDGDEEEIIGFILDCAVYNLGILFDKKGNIGFVHQHIRDYYAAVYDVNLLKLAVHQYEEGKHQIAIESLAPFQETPNGWDKTRFVGEYLGEDGNKPYQKGNRWIYNVPSEPCDRNLIKRALDIYRGRFDGTDGYGLYNLIEVLKLVREDLTGEDFTKLDFTGISLYGACLGHSNDGSGADFSGARINDETMLPVGHCDIVTSIDISPDNTRLLTVSVQPIVIKEWDIKSSLCIRSIGPIEDDFRGFLRVLYLSNDRILLKGEINAEILLSECILDEDEVQEKSFVYEIDLKKGEGKYKPNYYSATYGGKIELARDEKHLIVTDSNGVKLVNRADESVEYISCKDLTSRSNCIDEERHKCVFLSDDGCLEEWDMQENCCIARIDYYVEKICANNEDFSPEEHLVFLQYSPDGSRFYSRWQEDYTAGVIEWESETGEQLHCYPPCWCFWVSSDSNSIISYKEKELNAWNTKTHSKLWSATIPANMALYFGVFSKDDSLFAALGRGKDNKSTIVCVFDTMNGLCARKAAIGIIPWEPQIALSQHDDVLFYTKHNRIEKWSIPTCECIGTQTIGKVPINGIRVADDNTAIAWTNNRIIRFNPKTLMPDETQILDLACGASDELKNEFINDVQLKCMEDGSAIGLVATTGFIIIVNIISMEIKQIWSVDGEETWSDRSFRLGKTGRAVYLIGREKSQEILYVWDVLKDIKSKAVDLHMGKARDDARLIFLALSPNEDRIAVAHELFYYDSETSSASLQSVIKEYDIVTGECLHTVTLLARYTGLSLEYLSGNELLYCQFFESSDNKVYSKIDIKEERIVWQRRGNYFAGENILVYISDANDEKGKIEIWDFNMKTCYQKIPVQDGLIVNGCKFKNLYPDSKIDRDLLKKYGAEM